MCNWKIISLISVIALAAMVTAAYSLDPRQTIDPLPSSPTRTASALHASSNARMSRLHVAQSQCIADGQTCILYGTPCCGTDICAGPFPNTTCQAKSTP